MKKIAAEKRTSSFDLTIYPNESGKIGAADMNW